MNEHINSIPKIYTAGVRQNVGIFKGPVVVEEKYDGSQFTFGLVPEGPLDTLRCRSKSTMINPADPGMFKAAYETALRLMLDKKLTPGWVYCCEFISKPKHNVLTYARVPAGYLVLYDIRITDYTTCRFATPQEKQAVAVTLGIEPVKQIAAGEFFSFQDAWLTADSSLGIANIEGVVIKNYGLPHDERPGWPMTAKVVRPQFKEKQAGQCAHVGPKAEQGDAVEKITRALRTEARWLKAIQHLREAGKLVNDAKDIGPLVREIQADVFAEEREWIATQLLEAFGPQIQKGIVNGFAQYYKSILSEGLNAFQDEVTKSKS